MRPWSALAALALALPVLLGLPTLAADGAERLTPTSNPTPAQASGQVEIVGSVVAVDLQRHRATVSTATGPVEVGWDRNTLIYQPGGASTAAALKPGTFLKAGLDPARTAYWIQLRPVAAPAAATLPTPAPAPPAPPR